MTRRKLRVGVLFGGRSGEHEVSLASAASVLRALDPEKYDAVPIGISKDGRWLVGTSAQRLLSEVLQRGEHVLLPADPTAGALMRMDSNTRRGARKATLRVDVVFPVLHGTFGEDGTVQGLLELAGLPYVGAGVLGSAVGMDKDVQKRLLAQAGLPIVPFVAIRRTEWEKEPETALREIRSKLRFPIFVKPAGLGSSVGMTRVKNATGLPAAMNLAAEFGQKIVVEKAMNAREIEVAVLGNENPRASVPGEVISHREFYDYAAKYLEEGTRLVIPAPLKPRTAARIQEFAIRAFRAIEGAGMARADFFLERRTGRIYINELNTIPGFTSISMYPKMWEASGLPYAELLDRLIALALESHKEKSRTKYAVELPRGGSGALQS